MINKIAGAWLRGLQKLIFLWILAVLVTAFSGSYWEKAVILQIESNKSTNGYLFYIIDLEKDFEQIWRAFLRYWL